MEQLHQTNRNELGGPMMPTYMRGWMLNQSRLGILLEAYLVRAKTYHHLSILELSVLTCDVS